MIEEPELTRSEGPVEWLRKFRVHPEFPKLARNPLSTVESAQICQAEAAWLESSVGIHWLRSLQIEDAIIQWSEVFWRRDRRGGGRRPRRDKRFHRRTQAPPQNNLPSPESDTRCQEMDDLGFFDNATNW